MPSKCTYQVCFMFIIRKSIKLKPLPALVLLEGAPMFRLLCILVLATQLAGCATAAFTTLATGAVAGAAAVAIAKGGVGSPF